MFSEQTIDRSAPVDSYYDVTTRTARRIALTVWRSIEAIRRSMLEDGFVFPFVSILIYFPFRQIYLIQTGLRHGKTNGER